MEAGLKAALGAALGGELRGARPISGGDINQAYEIALADGRRLFAKTNARAPRGMFEAEARGLAWLVEANALRIPDVVAVSPGEDQHQFLVLELIASRPPAPDFDERLGRGLASLHRRGAPGFGLDHDNFIGRLPQANAPTKKRTLKGSFESPAGEPGRAKPVEAHGFTETWVDFYRSRRLEEQLRRSIDEGRATARMRRGFDRLFATLEDLVGPPEPPARLHGDLWGGNLLCDERGAPCLIDPAVYGGHREMDLAMMRLFGGFGARVFAAYDEAWPLADGHRERVGLYQLYPLMVHVNLFGGSYVGSVEAALDRLT
jgi:fructosamine-3-kinase